LSAGERELLRHLAPQLQELLNRPDEPALRRLFPPAYHQEAHAEHQDEYRRLMQEDLVAHHRDALDTLATTAEANELSEEQLWTWLRALNSLRLVLGTLLDVSEDDDPNDATSPEQLQYLLLGFLQESAIDALSGER
jgi:hypothetical protein